MKKQASVAADGTLSIGLEDVPPLGPIHFLKAEWRNAAAPFVLIRYSVGGKEPEFGVSMDLDKKVILDDFDYVGGGDFTDDELRARTEAIWRTVANVRAKDIAFAPK